MPRSPRNGPVITTQIPDSLIEKASETLRAAGLPFDQRRIKRTSQGSIEIDLNPDIERVLNPPRPPRPGRSRR